MPSSPKRKKKTTQEVPPSEELVRRLQELEIGIGKARKAFVDSLQPPAEAPQPITSTPSGFGRFFRRKSDHATSGTPSKKVEDTSAPSSSIPDADSDRTGLESSSMPKSKLPKKKGEPEVSFVEIRESEVFVENLRRVAELVVIGENYVTSLQRKEEAAFLRAKEKWKSRQLDVLGENEEDDDRDEGETDDDQKDLNKEEYVQLFDLFFEHNTLELVISLLTGSAFHFTDEEKRELDNHDNSQPVAVSDGSDYTKNKDDHIEPGALTLTQPRLSEQLYKYRRLPPIQIATQALQSVSILIQNVSRATSLYFILSNNRINELINLPLDLYVAAERRRQSELGNESAHVLAFSSPEIAELTTHFVTFLKSLALRMNAQTLQFFLKYPAETRAPRYDDKSSANGEPDDGLTVNETPASPLPLPSVQIEFPLYERALEFCAAHQDSFVRLTAMNICLNTLRLTAVSLSEEFNDPQDGSSPRPPGSPTTPRSPVEGAGSSPDGVLHNAKPLPFRERLAIAHYTCSPSRVERLVSPIFTKLAERWNLLDEQIREVDSNVFDVSDGSLGGSHSNKLMQAKEKVRRERMVRVLKDRAADMQDELLLLEDVFKVGLTVFNEQLIEMMFATFVYPLLLQPLLLYYQRLAGLLDKPSDSDGLGHPLGGFIGTFSNGSLALSSASGPAKAALVTISYAFEVLGNKPLLRLLFAALMHPLSPDTTGVPTLRTSLEVSRVTRDGRNRIRLDEQATYIECDRATYDFGTKPGNRRVSKLGFDLSRVQDESEACVFVLAPALAEVLEFNGEDTALIARTRSNPYRRAILQLLEGPDTVSDVRDLAVVAVNMAVKKLDTKLASDVAFGTDLKSLSADIPLDERTLDSIRAHQQDDRGIGGSAAHESRMSLARQKGGPVGSDLTAEVVRALCKCIVVAAHESRSVAEWRIEHDAVAVHSLLYLAQGSARAMDVAAKTVENVWRQTARFIGEVIGKIHSPMGGSSIPLDGCPSINDPTFDQFVEGSIANYIVFQRMDALDKAPAINELLHLSEQGSDYCVGISFEGSVASTCSRISRRLTEQMIIQGSPSDRDEVHMAREFFVTLLKVDALLLLLKEMAATDGRVLEGATPTGLVLSSKGGIAVSMRDCHEADLDKQVYAPLSPSLIRVLFPYPSTTVARTGSSIDFSGNPFLPCVCEAPASLSSLFSGDGLGVVSEGVTWQSLYLFFLDGALVLAQPLPDGDGRVVTCCYLERLTVQLDSLVPDEGPPARRLILSHESYKHVPPTLFLFNELPKDEKLGPLTRVRSFTSTLDVWFEDQSAADHAYRVISSHVLACKSKRGHAVKAFLTTDFCTAPLNTIAR